MFGEIEHALSEYVTPGFDVPASLIAAHAAVAGSAGLYRFEMRRRWRQANVVHGDPVFSNVLLTDDGRIFLLDMRGELGSVLTLQVPARWPSAS